MRFQYPVNNAVSIWIGTFKNEDEMDRCVDGVIEPSLQLPQPLSSICEINLENTPVPLKELLEGFSGWQTFAAKAAEVAALNGVTEANCAIVCYYLSCEAQHRHWPGVLYLGTFSGKDVV